MILATTSQAQSVDISLNLKYNDPSNPALGGNWTLVAKTTSLNGIAAINAIMSNVNATGITYQGGIGAMLDLGSPFVINNGSSIELLYVQDLSDPASVVTDVGRGAGTPGNLAIDPLNDPNWNNAAVIANGTFGALKPAFTSNPDPPPDVTDANVLGTKTPPFFSLAATPVTTIVRDSLLLLGDYNRNGTVDAADQVVWRNTLGTEVTQFAGADGNGNGKIDSDDYTVWRSHFGQIAGSGSGVGANLAVPEPAALTTCLTALAALLGVRFRRRAAH